jgi:hypothetical protein
VASVTGYDEWNGKVNSATQSDNAGAEFAAGTSYENAKNGSQCLVNGNYSR